MGVSADSVRSHQKFIAKNDLPFPLLADTEKVICNLYGVWGLKKFMGREYEGINRTTYIIDEDGRIAKVFEKVKPAGHGEDVLDALRSLK